MALSDAAAREIATVLRDHVDLGALDRVIDELLEIRGDKDFRDTIERFVYALRMTSGR
jgi:hypothetical protein